MNPLIRFLRQPADNQVLLLYAGITVATVKFSLLVLPFHWLRQVLIWSGRTVGYGQRTTISAERIAWSVRRAGRYLSAACLPQAVSAYFLLCWHGHSATLRIGVQYRQHGDFSAHAWVECQGQIILGDLPGLAQYTVLPDIVPLA